jgi:hypothetical protein
MFIKEMRLHMHVIIENSELSNQEKKELLSVPYVDPKNTSYYSNVILQGGLTDEELDAEMKMLMSEDFSKSASLRRRPLYDPVKHFDDLIGRLEDLQYETAAMGSKGFQNTIMLLKNDGLRMFSNWKKENMSEYVAMRKHLSNEMIANYWLDSEKMNLFEDIRQSNLTKEAKMVLFRELRSVPILFSFFQIHKTSESGLVEKAFRQGKKDALLYEMDNTFLKQVTKDREGMEIYQSYIAGYSEVRPESLFGGRRISKRH